MQLFKIIYQELVNDSATWTAGPWREEIIEANSTAFSAGWLTFYVRKSLPNGTSEKLVLTVPVWRIREVREI